MAEDVQHEKRGVDNPTPVSDDPNSAGKNY